MINARKHMWPTVKQWQRIILEYREE